MKLISFGEIIWDVYPDKAVLGGAPLNFAAHAASQNCKVSLISAVGNDELGEKSLIKISGFGISCDAIQTTNFAPTGVCNVTLNTKGVPTYQIASHSAYDYITYANTKLECDAFAFGSLALRYPNNVNTIKQILSNCSTREVFCDLNIRPPYFSNEVIDLCFSNATIIKVSDEDLKHFSNNFSDERNIITTLSKKYTQIKIFIVTKGEYGSICFDAVGEQWFECSAEKTTVISTVGAGDSFGATFLVKYLQTNSIRLALSFASKVSAFVVSRKEAIPEDIGAFINNLTSKS